MRPRLRGNERLRWPHRDRRKSTDVGEAIADMESENTAQAMALYGEVPSVYDEVVMYRAPDTYGSDSP